MEFGLYDGGENGEYNGVSLVEIFNTFEMRDEFSDEMTLFDDIYQCLLKSYRMSLISLS